MKNVIRTLALVAAMAVPTAPAFASTVFVARPPVVRVTHPVVHVSTPAIHLSFGFDPWNPRAAAVYRPGYVWVAGHYDRYGYWNPGYYRPLETRAGFAYEPGYWSNGVYVDGFWRPERVEREHWVPGHYTPNRGFVPGHWSR